MKRTQRPKDWSQATALGLQLLEAGDDHGWLHVFDAEALLQMAQRIHPSDASLRQRPVLRLILTNDRMLERAVQTEIDFWTRLDRLRLGAYRRAAAEYTARIRNSEALDQMPLLQQHRTRVVHAEACLPESPLTAVIVRGLVEEARTSTGLGLDPALIGLLPRVGPHFEYEDFL